MSGDVKIGLLPRQNKMVFIVTVLILLFSVLACGDRNDSEIIELQATVLAMTTESREPLATYAPLPTLEPLPTYTPLPALEPLPTYTPLPALEPLPTYTPLPTLEPLPTYTPLPTLEPLPTYTPLPTLEPIIIILTPTAYPTPSPTPTPLGYFLVKDMSGIVDLDLNGMQGAITGNIDSPSDEDIYKFEGFVGQTLIVTMNSSLGSSIDPFLDLLDPQNERITHNDDSNGQNSYISRTLNQNGTHTIIARSATMSSLDFGEYTLTLQLSQAPN